MIKKKQGVVSDNFFTFENVLIHCVTGTVYKQFICTVHYLSYRPVPSAWLFSQQAWILKGQCHEIFNHWFLFHQTIPPRALIHGLKPFCLWFRIRRENRNNSLQSLDPAVSMTPRDQTFFVRVPLLIFMFFSNYMYVMFTYVFLFAMVSL
jgi:hypothetical protein